ncbi:MAG TPA: hypothetical protein VF376_06400 [Thermoanaerobaculia bacterium]
MKDPRPAAAGWFVFAAALLLAFSAVTARAELVVLDDGRVVKAASTRVAGDSLEVRLLGGGSFSIDRARVEKVVDDEVAPGDMPAPRVVAETLGPRPQARGTEAVAPAPLFVPPAPAQNQPDQARGHDEKSKGIKSGGGNKSHRGGGH